MHRCLELARLGSGYVSPNPMVGAVLVCDKRIIGEGYHMVYGGPHAEVNCINSVLDDQKHLISRSVLYVSLEPCAHYGKTPPCADLIIKNHIPEVIIGCLDSFSEVDGRGMQKLEAAGIVVKLGILERECRYLNRRFFTFHLRHRPFILLKWAETGDRKIANTDYSRLMITNELTNRTTHKWRTEEAGLMVGANTVLYDNPSLTNRFWPGASPVRIIVDMELRMPSFLNVFNNQAKTIVFNARKQAEENNLLFCQLSRERSLVQQAASALYALDIGSVMIEGGSRLLQSFIDEGIWDEARVITNHPMIAGEGISSPVLSNEKWLSTELSGSDTIQYYGNKLLSTYD